MNQSFLPVPVADGTTENPTFYHAAQDFRSGWWNQSNLDPARGGVIPEPRPVPRTPSNSRVVPQLYLSPGMAYPPTTFGPLLPYTPHPPHIQIDTLPQNFIRGLVWSNPLLAYPAMETWLAEGQDPYWVTRRKPVTPAPILPSSNNANVRSFARAAWVMAPTSDPLFEMFPDPVLS